MTPYNALPLYPTLYETYCHCVIKSLWHPTTHFPCTLLCTKPTVIVSLSHYDTLQRTSPVPYPCTKPTVIMSLSHYDTLQRTSPCTLPCTKPTVIMSLSQYDAINNQEQSKTEEDAKVSIATGTAVYRLLSAWFTCLPIPPSHVVWFCNGI